MTVSYPQGTSRRAALGALGLAGVGALTAGCGSPIAAGIAGAGPNATSLTYWNLFTGGDGINMVAMTDRFRATHPSVHVDAVTLAWGTPYYTKLALAVIGDRPPDVAITHLSRLPTLAEGNLVEPLRADDLTAHGLTGDRFTAAAWRKGQVGGQQYAVPLDTHPFVMFYRTDVCKKAGLLDATGKLKPIEGTDGLVAALSACAKVTGGYGGVVNVNADPATCWRWFDTLYGQLGGQVLADNGTRIVLDDAKAEKALSFARELTVQRKLMPSNIDGSGVTQLFASGKVGLLFDGEWQIPTYQGAKTPFSVAPVPNLFGGTYHCFADSHALILPRNARRDAQRRDESLTLVRGLLDNSLIWAKGGHIPAFREVQDSAAFRKMQPQAQYVPAAKAAIYDPAGWYSGAGSDFENIMGFAVSAVEAGQLHPAAAIAQLRQKLADYASKPAPVGGTDR
jgi:multiple sugar transport system substrate-binding protein